MKKVKCLIFPAILFGCAVYSQEKASESNGSPKLLIEGNVAFNFTLKKCSISHNDGDEYLSTMVFHFKPYFGAFYQ